MRVPFAITLLFVAGDALAIGGMTGSGGGEFVTTERSPWFVGAAPVTYCVAHDEASMSLPRARAESLIADALADWTKTLRALKPRPMYLPTALDHWGHLTLDFKLVACAGEPDLVFRLGAADPAIGALMQGQAGRIVATALRTSYDEESARGKGVIWLIPDRGPVEFRGPFRDDFWSAEAAFFNTVLHEIGHMFGFTHHEEGGDLPMHPEVPAHSAWFDPKYQVRATAAGYLLLDWRQYLGRVCGEQAYFDEGARKAFGMTEWYADTCVAQSGEPGTVTVLPAPTFTVTAVVGGVTKRLDLRYLEESGGADFEVKSCYHPLSIDAEEDAPPVECHVFIALRLRREVAGVATLNGKDIPVLIRSTDFGAVEVLLWTGARFGRIVMTPGPVTLPPSNAE